MNKRLTQKYVSASSFNLLLWGGVFFFKGLPVVLGHQTLESLDVVGVFSILGILVSGALLHSAHSDFKNS